MATNIFDLKTRIVSEFGFLSHPKPDQINPYPCCIEHDAMTEWFQKHTWKDFQEELKKGTLDSEFMPNEPEGYIYFLPAVLLYTLESYEIHAENIWEWKTISETTCAPISYWITVLIPVFNKPIIANYQEKRKKFNHNQIKVIQDYLSFFIDVSPDEEANFKKDARIAIQELWNE
ncbi:MAG: hypothetical protein U0V02_06280 [Anaerolineales bacterium]